MRRHLISTLILGTIASPAAAQATQVSEPSDFALFALGVIGIVLGHRAARRRP